MRNKLNLSRREFLALAGGGAATVLLPGCADQRDPRLMARQLVVALDENVNTLDPAYAVRALDGFVICNIMETLTWFDRDLNLIPRLALSWETHDQANSWIFRLRSNVKFHDGTEFNAEAVKFHFDRLKNPQTRSKRVTKVARLAGIDVLDPLTVRFRMSQPYSVWPVVVRDSFGAIVSPTAVRRLGNEAYTRHPVGTGPYEFSAQRSDRFVRLKRNPAYWNKNEFTVEEVEFRPIKEPTTRLILLEQGAVDVGSLSFAHTEAAEKAGRIEVLNAPLLATRYIGFNCMKPPFDDVRVRRACNLAVNRSELIRYAFRGNADPSKGPLPMSMPNFNHAMPSYEYDLEKSRALLKSAGHDKAITAVLWSKDDAIDSNLGVVIADQLRRIGIHVQIVRFDRNVYWDKFDPYQTLDGKWYPDKEGVFDLYAASWVGGEHPHGYLDPLFRSSSASNASFYKNKRLDDLLDASLSTADPAEQKRIYDELQHVIVADAPWIFCYHSRTMWGVNRRVANLHIHPGGEYEFQGVTLGGVTGTA